MISVRYTEQNSLDWLDSKNSDLCFASANCKERFELNFLVSVSAAFNQFS